LKNLKESFKYKFNKEISIELDRDCPTHIPVETMIDIVFETSKKAGLDSYLVLKHFQFTEEEIRDYFERLGKRTEI
jgi:Tfp pilus assembly protein PilO